MGMLAGAPDLIFLHNGEAFALELKSPKGRQSKSQEIFSQRWYEAGGEYAITYNLDEALAVLDIWGIIR